MSIRSYARQVFTRTGCNVGQNLARNFGVPTTLQFGDIADPGTSDEFSRADHQHGMPASADQFFNSYLKFGFSTSELLTTSNTSPELPGVVTRLGGAIILGNDEADTTGGHGMIGVNFGVASPGQGSGAIVMTNEIAANWDTDSTRHTVQNLRKFQFRGGVRRATTTQRPQNVWVAIGAFNVPRVNGGTQVYAIQDGLGFVGFFDASTVGTWKCRIYNNGTVTEADTGVGINFDSVTGVTSFQNFTIIRTEDGLLHFYIDNVERGILSPDNLPTNKTAGWGIYGITEPLTVQNAIWADDILVRNERPDQI